MNLRREIGTLTEERGMKRGRRSGRWIFTKIEFEKLGREREEERGEREHHQRKKHEAPLFYSLLLITHSSSSSSLCYSSSSFFFSIYCVLCRCLDQIVLIPELHAQTRGLLDLKPLILSLILDEFVADCCWCYRR